jgi:hypothetical protein
MIRTLIMRMLVSAGEESKWSGLTARRSWASDRARDKVRMRDEGGKMKDKHCAASRQFAGQTRCTRWAFGDPGESSITFVLSAG